MKYVLLAATAAMLAGCADPATGPSATANDAAPTNGVRAGAANPVAGNGPFGTGTSAGGGGVATGNGPIGGMSGGPNGDATQGAPKSNPPLMGNESRGS